MLKLVYGVYIDFLVHVLIDLLCFLELFSNCSKAIITYEGYEILLFINMYCINMLHMYLLVRNICIYISVLIVLNQMQSSNCSELSNCLHLLRSLILLTLMTPSTNVIIWLDLYFKVHYYIVLHSLYVNAHYLHVI